MSTYTDNRDVWINGEGPNGEEPLAPAPTMTEFIERDALVLCHLHRYLSWKLGQGTPEPPLNEEPYATWEARWTEYDWDGRGEDAYEEMRAEGHVALFP